MHACFYICFYTVDAQNVNTVVALATINPYYTTKNQQNLRREWVFKVTFCQGVPVCLCLALLG